MLDVERREPRRMGCIQAQPRRVHLKYLNGLILSIEPPRSMRRDAGDITLTLCLSRRFNEFPLWWNPKCMKYRPRATMFWDILKRCRLKFLKIYIIENLILSSLRDLRRKLELLKLRACKLRPAKNQSSEIITLDMSNDLKNSIFLRFLKYRRPIRYSRES